MIKHLSNHEIEILSQVVSAVGSKVIHVIDDDERRLEIVNRGDNIVEYRFITLIESPQVVKTHEPQVIIGNGEVLLEVIDDGTHAIEGVDGINPKHLVAGGGILLAFGHLKGLREGVTTVEHGGGKHLGDGMGTAVGSSCQESDFVTVEDGCIGDVDDGVWAVDADVFGTHVNEHLFPRRVFIGDEGFAIVMHST